MSNNSWNKGEWSKLYLVLCLLYEERLYIADENGNIESKDNYKRILGLLREEKEIGKIVYSISRDGVTFTAGKQPPVLIKKTVLKAYINYLFNGIINGNDRTFSLSSADDIMKKAGFGNLKSKINNKADIELQLADRDSDRTYSFRICSELGKSPTLLNASGATNITYRIQGIDHVDADCINNIETPSLINDRLQELRKRNGVFSDATISNDVFRQNLLSIDPNLIDVLSEVLLYYYQTGNARICDVCKALDSENNLSLEGTSPYTAIIEKLLCAIALGMLPSKRWNEQSDLIDGVIILKSNGEAAAFYSINYSDFSKYLIENTRFEKGSTTRHNYASVFSKDEKYFMNLNLQIRFV